ncbi:hypothetical protein D3C71_2114020 [compost metagenome]
MAKTPVAFSGPVMVTASPLTVPPLVDQIPRVMVSTFFIIISVFCRLMVAPVDCADTP